MLLLHNFKNHVILRLAAGWNRHHASVMNLKNGNVLIRNDFYRS